MNVISSKETAGVAGEGGEDGDGWCEGEFVTINETGLSEIRWPEAAAKDHHLLVWSSFIRYESPHPM